MEQYVSPHNTLQHILTGMWEDRLGLSRIGTKDGYLELGETEESRDAMLWTVQELFQARLSGLVLSRPLTVERLAEELLRVLPLTPEVRGVHTGDPTLQMPLFYLHGDLSGGGYYTYLLGTHLGSDRPLYVLAPHGLNGREIPASVEEMAEDQLVQLRNFRPSGPYCLAGFCSGALVALEMAHVLLQRGHAVPLLALVDAPVPWSVASDAPRPADYEAPADWKDQPGVRGLWLFNQSLVPVRKYSPRHYPGRITLIRSNAPVSRVLPEPGRWTREWSEVTAELEFYSLPGDHVTCVSRYVREFGGILSGCLHAVEKLQRRIR